MKKPIIKINKKSQLLKIYTSAPDQIYHASVLNTCSLTSNVKGLVLLSCSIVALKEEKKHKP